MLNNYNFEIILCKELAKWLRLNCVVRSRWAPQKGIAYNTHTHTQIMPVCQVYSSQLWYYLATAWHFPYLPKKKNNIKFAFDWWNRIGKIKVFDWDFYFCESIESRHNVHTMLYTTWFMYVVARFYVCFIQLSCFFFVSLVFLFCIDGLHWNLYCHPK